MQRLAVAAPFAFGIVALTSVFAVRGRANESVPRDPWKVRESSFPMPHVPSGRAGTPFERRATGETTGAIEGTIYDSALQPLNGATIVVTSRTIQGERAVLSDAHGSYRFADLHEGPFSITVYYGNETDDYKTVVHDGYASVNDFVVR
jgi:hypothetical protein